MRFGDQVYDAWKAARRGDAHILKSIAYKLQTASARPEDVDALINSSNLFFKEIDMGSSIARAYWNMLDLAKNYSAYLRGRNKMRGGLNSIDKIRSDEQNDEVDGRKQRYRNRTGSQNPPRYAS